MAPQLCCHSFPEGSSVGLLGDNASRDCGHKSLQDATVVTNDLDWWWGNQLVVQEAWLTILSELPYFAWYRTIANTRPSAEGATMMALFVPPLKWTLAFSRAVETLEDATNMLSTSCIYARRSHRALPASGWR